MPKEIFILHLSVMERPVRILTSDPDLLATMEEAYAAWRPATRTDGAPITIDLHIIDTDAGLSHRIDVDGPFLSMSGDGIDGWADAGILFATCKVPKYLIGRPGQLAEELTDTLLLFLLTRSGRTPLHAAGIALGNRAILLTGASGSGKSTLTLAAMRRDLRILSDDTVYIQLQPRLRIWGFPRPVHVFPDDAPGFIAATRLRGGKLKAAIPAPFPAEPPVADHPVVVVLERGETIRMDPIEPAIAAAALSRLEPGFDLLARASASAASAIVARGAWRLTLARDPDAAMDALIGRLEHDAMK
ncbi:phosphoenolpyruvate carboxykinase (ATP) [Gluconacetobacter tumulicola]|uniref:HPr kinase n=1 Tax=Gluconacetobacter tumulicola TaxID=1017177 RepID=A0A7W4P814_9PROT|nr:hypothetical protein [Gluconacetobacter tumulicola]MBB2178918.1 hypothetical protein [Gluconacetobacter tumulicola]